MCPGLHHREYSQQIEGYESHSLLNTCQATPFVPWIPKGHRKTGEGPGEDNQNDQGVGELDMCDGLTLAGRQVPTKAVLSLPHPQLDRGEKNITKSLRVEIRTGEIIH